MEYYPEDHHKKPKAAQPVATDISEEQKEAAQNVQKKLNVQLEELKEHVDRFEINTDRTQLDKVIVQEKIAEIHNVISIDEMLAPHIQEQIDTLRLYEARFNGLV